MHAGVDFLFVLRGATEPLEVSFLVKGKFG